MKKKIILSLVLVSIILVIVGCQNQTDLIGLRRIEYKPERSVLHVYYFPTKAEADSYFKGEGLSDYFLFEINSKNSKKVFDNIKGEQLEENKKKMVFTADSKNSAIDKVVNFIDKNNMLRIHGPN